MKNAIKFLVKLLFFSVLLFLLKNVLAFVYQFLLLGACYLLGMSFSAASLPYESAWRMIPLIALVLATPGLGVKKRGGVILLGFLIFLTLDLVSTLIWGALPSRIDPDRYSSHIVYSLIWELFGHWIMPFIIWIAAAHKEIACVFREVLPAHLHGVPLQVKE